MCVRLPFDLLLFFSRIAGAAHAAPAVSTATALGRLLSIFTTVSPVFQIAY
jgi:hypothetical protein